MREYKIELKLVGAMTQVPDSQKLFGALVYLFTENFGNEKATALTEAVIEKRMHLALSSVMPSGYLPTPQDYLIDHIYTQSNIDVDLKKRRAAIKERAYIQLKNLNNLKHSESCDDVFPYVKLENLQQLRASIESTFYDIPELDTRLYSVPTVALSEISFDKATGEHRQAVNTYCFYLQVDDGKLVLDLLDMLAAAVHDNSIIILGKRVSQGLNTFRFHSMEEQKRRSSKLALF